MDVLSNYYWLSNDENTLTDTNDTSTFEVSTKEVDTSESNNTTEIHLLEEIRDYEKEQTAYLSFFVIMVLGGFVVYRLMKFLQNFMW